MMASTPSYVLINQCVVHRLIFLLALRVWESDPRSHKARVLQTPFCPSSRASGWGLTYPTRTTDFHGGNDHVPIVPPLGMSLTYPCVSGWVHYLCARRHEGVLYLTPSRTPELERRVNKWIGLYHYCLGKVSHCTPLSRPSVDSQSGVTPACALPNSPELVFRHILHNRPAMHLWRRRESNPH